MWEQYFLKYGPKNILKKSGKGCERVEREKGLGDPRRHSFVGQVCCVIGGLSDVTVVVMMGLVYISDPL